MKTDLHIVPPDPRIHREELFELIAHIFSRGGYFDFRDRVRTYYMANSHYDW